MFAEVHEHETGIIYVLDGTATFVTGGKVVGGEMTSLAKFAARNGPFVLQLVSPQDHDSGAQR